MQYPERVATASPRSRIHNSRKKFNPDQRGDMRMKSMNLIVVCSFLAVILTGSSGCGGGSGQKTTRPAQPRSVQDTSVRSYDHQGLQGLDLSEYGAIERELDASAAFDLDQPAVQEDIWAVVLGTYSQDNHRTAARRMLGELPKVNPALSDAWLASDDNGTKVLYGRYASPTDATAQQQLQWVKSIQMQGRQVFPRAMLTRIETAGSGAVNPLDLMALRRQYPNVDPLYTLDVAVWIADDQSSARSFEACQRAAEQYARQLRTQGYPAFFYHDPVRRLSNVTIGAFGSNAVDPQTSFYHDDVRQLMQRFPQRLVNGEPLDVAQAPVLVHVPQK
jgi:hypothetical protein